MKINWKDHLVNLVVVILGISIAFWLNSWAEDKKSKKQEAIYLQSILKDLDDDLYEIDYIINNSASQVNSIIRLTSYSIGRPVEEDSLMNDLFKVQYVVPFTPQNVTYNSITTSGKLDLIDFTLKNQMLELYNQYYGRMDLWDLSCSQHIDDFIKPVVMREMEVTGQNTMRNEILKSRELRNALFSQQFVLQQRQDYLKIMRQATDSLKTNISTYLTDN